MTTSAPKAGSNPAGGGKILLARGAPSEAVAPQQQAGASRLPSTVYEAREFHGRTWSYVPEPRLSVVHELAPGTQLARDAPAAFLRLARRLLDLDGQPGRTGELAAIYDQVYGRSGPMRYELVLITQMGVGADRDEDFNAWYHTRHLPQAAGIPGFGSDHRRFQLVSPLPGTRLGAPPRYVTLYELHADADVVATINSPAFARWAADFTERWAPHVLRPVSTMCARLASANV